MSLSLPTSQSAGTTFVPTTRQRRVTTSAAEAPAGSHYPTTERFVSSESRPEFMDLGRQRWNNPTLISTSGGRPQTKVQKAMQDAGLKASLAKFSPQLQQQVSGLSDAQLKVLKGGMSGSTQVGPLTVDNRKAFIKGSVALKSIWGNVHQSITDARTKYSMISQPEEKALHKLIDSVSGLKPDQRKQLAELMDRVR
jgi:hypothetical protein